MALPGGRWSQKEAPEATAIAGKTWLLCGWPQLDTVGRGWASRPGVRLRNGRGWLGGARGAHRVRAVPAGLSGESTGHQAGSAPSCGPGTQASTCQMCLRKA